MTGFSDLTYWPRQHAAGFLRLWQFNGPTVACRLTLFNLFGVRRTFHVRLHGFSVELRSGTPDLAVAIDSLGDEFAPLAAFPDPGGLIIDAGGYIGTAALKLAKMFPRSSVLTLEPSTENIAVLRRNVADIGNIVVRQAALAARAGETMLHDAGSGEWGYSLLPGTAAAPARAIGNVSTLSVADVLAQRGRDRLFVLKLDVEGAELGILAASDGWMSRTDVLVAELHEKLAPGTQAAFDAATAGRANTRLPGEKVMSVRV